MTTKGIVCNEFYPTLGALCGRVDAGVWNWGNALPSNFQVLFDLSHATPTPQWIEQVLNACPFQVAGWMAGFNEPDLTGKTAEQIAAKTKADMSAVLAVDSQAQFSIFNFSQVQGFHTVLSRYVWNQLKDEPNADKIVSANLHYYAEADDNAQENLFNTAPLVDFLKMSRDKMQAKGFGHLELLVTEIGIGASTGSAFKRKNYPGKVQDACEISYNGHALAEKWFWYQMEQREVNAPRGLYLSGVVTEVGIGFSEVG